jgi:peptidylprolyl isomerase
VKEVPVRPSTRFNRVPALLGAAALLAASLAGCTAIPGFGGCQPAYQSGDASSIVTATGKVGSKPKVDFPTPLVSATPEVSVIEAGDGALVRDGSQVDFDIAVFYGKDGQNLSGDEVASDRQSAGIEDNAFSTALVCAQVGDRLAITTTVEDAYGKGAGDSVGLTDDDTLVIVVDIRATYPGKADGFNQLPQDGMPVVVTAVDGAPAIAVNLVTKPTTTRIETVKGGDGAPVRSDDKVVVQMRVWTWPDEGGDPSELTNFSTWAGDKAYTMTLDDNKNPLPAGVLRAVEGSRIGSQLLIVIPPGEDGYVTPPEGMSEDATMIWVVDLLGIDK